MPKLTGMYVLPHFENLREPGNDICYRQALNDVFDVDEFNFYLVRQKCDF